MKELNDIQACSDKIHRLKKAIADEILQLPDNPNIRRLPTNPHAFVMRSKDVFNVDNKYDRIDVFFHDFKAQYEALAKIIEHSTPENVLKNLQKVVETGRHTQASLAHHHFNPAVLKHLKALIEAD